MYKVTMEKDVVIDGASGTTKVTQLMTRKQLQKFEKNARDLGFYKTILTNNGNSKKEIKMYEVVEMAKPKKVTVIEGLSELDQLKLRADELGITYSARIGYAKLLEKIEDIN